MAEAEDVITDAARHATIFVRDLWQRHRPADGGPARIALVDVSRRLELLVRAVFGRPFPIRPAQPPAPPSLLDVFFRRRHRPWQEYAVPATDGHSILLPAQCGLDDPKAALDHYRVAALQQAMRAVRGSPRPWAALPSALHRHLYLLIEAHAADAELTRILPGMADSAHAMRRAALAQRPRITEFSGARRRFEAYVRDLLGDCGMLARHSPPTAPTPEDSARLASRLAAEYHARAGAPAHLGANALFKDWWTGELHPAAETDAASATVATPSGLAPDRPPRSARLTRRPKVRDPREDEDRDEPGLWMVQTGAPEEHAEDPFGLQRPTDQDEDTAAADFADSLSELPEARLIRSAEPAKEVLLSDDPPPTAAHGRLPISADATALSYPEWDYRTRAYRMPGAIVRIQTAEHGPQEWIDDTLARHRGMLQTIRNHFSMLRTRRSRLLRQLDGDDLDLNAVVEAQADFRAGLPLSQSLYQSSRTTRRDMAMLLLVDISGSTDSWVSAHRRVIDVEREALLLVCHALESLGEPYAVVAFSGQGPANVMLRTVKQFDEHYGNEIALRIAALEPEHYTRTGAAIRHASSLLMRQPVSHRLLLMLSDGKPNDLDEYDGPYGVADMRQAVSEARMQGMQAFCLTIDHKAPAYLPGVFGAHQYALLPRPERLPTALLDWIKRLLRP